MQGRLISTQAIKVLVGGIYKRLQAGVEEEIKDYGHSWTRRDMTRWCVGLR